MQIKVEVVKELEDGSAVVLLDINKEAKEFLIQEGFMSLLHRTVEQFEEEEEEEEEEEDEEENDEDVEL